MPFIRLKEPSSPTKHMLEDVEMDYKVAEIKDRAFRLTNIPVVEQNLIYCGKLMKDEITLRNYGVEDGCTVFVIRKRPKEKPFQQEASETSVENVLQVLEAAIKSPSYRKTVEKILGNPEMMEQLIAATPGLSEDLTAMALLQDQELLQQVIETADIEQVVRQHPCLVEAASYIAAATATEGGEGRSGRLRNLHNSSMDEDMPDVEPGVLARAEMIAAQEESIQGASGSGRARQVTASMLASALASAGLPSMSSSGEGPSTSSSSSSQPISREIFADAFASALAGVSSTNDSSSASMSSTSTQTNTANLQAQLQQLRDMGITDDEVSLQALRATGGNVQAALEFIFGGT